MADWLVLLLDKAGLENASRTLGEDGACSRQRECAVHFGVDLNFFSGLKSWISITAEYQHLAHIFSCAGVLLLLPTSLPPVML